MSTKTAAGARPRVIEALQDKTTAPVQAGGPGGSADRAEMFDLMLADMDRRLDAIERRTDRIAARAA